jgi:hypothetical protein
MLFKQIVAVYSENHIESVNTHRGQNSELMIVKAGGTYRYHCALKCFIYIDRNARRLGPLQSRRLRARK